MCILKISRLLSLIYLYTQSIIYIRKTYALLCVRGSRWRNRKIPSYISIRSLKDVHLKSKNEKSPVPCLWNSTRYISEAASSLWRCVATFAISLMYNLCVLPIKSRWGNEKRDIPKGPRRVPLAKRGEPFVRAKFRPRTGTRSINYRAGERASKQAAESKMQKAR